MTREVHHSGRCGAWGIVALTALLAGCWAPPQTGCYAGPAGKLGTPMLEVKTDGTMTLGYGEVTVWGGLWTGYCPDLIETRELPPGAAPDEQSIIRYYRLDRAGLTFVMSPHLDELERGSTAPMQPAKEPK